MFHCVRHHHLFVNILGEDGTKVLAMYVDDPSCKDYGTYATDENRMRAAIRCIVPTIKRNAAKEVLAMLGDTVPARASTVTIRASISPYFAVTPGATRSVVEGVNRNSSSTCAPNRTFTMSAPSA